MARILVGLPNLIGKLEGYAQRFDLLEVHPGDAPLPAPSKLRGWRKRVPPSFAFSVVLPRLVGELGTTAAAQAALAQALEVARALEARCIVLATPPTVRPTSANRKRLAELVAKLPREGVVRCWEPSGLWEPADVAVTARDAALVPVFDAATENLPGGPIAYTRLRSLGKTTALGPSLLERVAARLHGRREAFVVVEGKRDAARVRAGLGAEQKRAAAAPHARGGGTVVVRPASRPLAAEDEEQ